MSDKKDEGQGHDDSLATELSKLTKKIEDAEEEVKQLKKHPVGRDDEKAHQEWREDLTAARKKEEQLRAEKLILLSRQQQPAPQGVELLLKTVLEKQEEMRDEAKKERDQLRPMYQEFHRKRKRDLVPWDRDSLRTKVRDPAFKGRLVVFYERNAEGGSLRCQVANEPFPSEHVIGAHIWKFETKGVGLENFGLSEADVENPRNGLLLIKGLEDAFDNMRVCFLYDFLHQKFLLHVADHTLLEQPVSPSTTITFQHLDGQPLLGRNLPYRRLLSWHAYNTMEKHGQLQLYKPYHRLSEGANGYDFPYDMIAAGAEASDAEQEDKQNEEEEMGL